MKKLLLTLNGIFLCLYGWSQNFNYSFTATTSTYTDLSSATSLISSGGWAGFHQKLGLGFNFNYMGRIFDSVNVSNVGFLEFDENNNFGFAAFGLPLDAGHDSVSVSSSISYLAEGTSGNKILKIQFKNCSISGETAFGHFDFQVWIYEAQNKIALITGGNTYSADSWDQYAIKIGLINNNELENNQMAFLLNGDINSPAASSANNGDALPVVTGLPSSNLSYSLTPNY